MSFKRECRWHTCSGSLNMIFPVSVHEFVLFHSSHTHMCQTDQCYFDLGSVRHAAHRWFCVWSVLVWINPQVAEATYESRGVGRYGAKLSSFCGPLFGPTGITEGIATTSIKFGLSSSKIHISARVGSKIVSASEDVTVESEG